MPTHAVIFDLDGTLIDSESACFEVAQALVQQHDRVLTKEVARAALGARPLEAWQVIVDQLNMDTDAATMLKASDELLVKRWPNVRTLPGALRLVEHLARHCQLPMAVVTSTLRASFDLKLSSHSALRGHFSTVVCGDEVSKGKPHPEGFLAAAAQLGVEPGNCLVFEDSPMGIQAAMAAGMQVLAVPSIVDKTAYSHLACPILPSLLDFRPEKFGLAPFGDTVAGTVPLGHVWKIASVVVRGFGRGSKELGIPTANLDEEALAGHLSDAVTGIYYGWASVGGSAEIYKTVMSIGYNPFYKNNYRTCEPWLLATFDSDFYGQELRLLVCGYIRPEADFTTLDDLRAHIHKDAAVATQALQHDSMQQYSTDSFLLPRGE